MRWMLMILLAVSLPSYGFLMPRFAIEVTVVDSEGVPVEEATVEGAYLGSLPGDGSLERETTDKDGVATVVGRSSYHVDVYVSKPGYYTSEVKVAAREVIDGKEHYRDRKVTVVLKEKRHPIPLYARRYSGEIPVAGEWVGFDLEKADWVAPYGKGGRADLEFRYEGEVASYLDINAELRMRFPTSGDGLHDASEAVLDYSEFKVAHEAPEGGYKNEGKVWKLVIGGQKPDAKYKASKSNYYFLRLRSTQGPDGEIIESNYAKVYRDIWFSPKALKKGVSKILFTYYFNPTPNDRNLEFNTYRNLFQGLSHDEEVREP